MYSKGKNTVNDIDRSSKSKSISVKEYQMKA